MGELVSLHVLVIAEEAAERELWRQGAALAPVPIDIVEAAGGAPALQAVHKGGVDIIIVDAALPDSSVIIATARALKPSPFVVIAQVRSAERPKGTDATIIKPRTVDEARLQIEKCVRAKIPARVLVVDDSSTMRSIVRKILGGCRYAMDLAEAEEGIAALQMMREGRFDFVFLDYNMPGLNGFETLQEIKREHPHTAVVMISSAVDGSMAERAQAAGAAAFLKKPFYPADIDAVFERHYELQTS